MNLMDVTFTHVDVANVREEQDSVPLQAREKGR